MTRATLALTVTLATFGASAQGAEVDGYQEVSYLVFPKAQGFDRPVFESDLLAGTLTIRFPRLKPNWRGLLEPQLATERKRRFFRKVEPLVEGGKIVGIVVGMGVPAFDVATYPKTAPQRWILRVGEHRTIPASMGALAVPVVSYADLIEGDSEARHRLGAAERALAAGQGGCTAIAELAAGTDEVSAWAALRDADCHALAGDTVLALKALGRANGGPVGAAALATIRTAELDGSLLSETANWTPFEAIRTGGPTLSGTVADEAEYRRVRAHFWRGEYALALAALEAFTKVRPESPFAQNVALAPGLRRRVVLEAAAAERWLDAARAYVAAPVPAEPAHRRIELDLIGARALREIGLGKQASRVYLGLLQAAPAGVDEATLMLELAETYTEDHDTARADVTLKYVEERFPNRRREATRLRGLLALAKGNVRAAAEAALALAPAPARRSAPLSEQAQAAEAKSATLVARTAAQALAVEGVPAARAVVAPLAARAVAADLASEVARDLAAAAGDCEALLQFARPLELASGDDLLLGSACLLGNGRLDEALVLVSAAQVWAAADLARPEVAALLETVRAQATFWLENHAEAAPPPATKNPGT